jgi:hypothetical protein
MSSTPDTVPNAAEEVDARTACAEGLRALADFIARTPGAPLPVTHLTRHFRDADEFDKAAAAIGEPVVVNGGYESCERRFGPLTYGVQTDEQARRQQRIAAREAELGLTPADGAL